MRKDEFSCDTVFVYKETNIHEILLDNSPVSFNKIISKTIYNKMNILLRVMQKLGKACVIDKITAAYTRYTFSIFVRTLI